MTTYPESEESFYSPPRWTKELPTTPGYYWFRGDAPFEISRPVIVEVCEPLDDLPFKSVISVASPFRHRVDDLKGEWCGPLEAPM